MLYTIGRKNKISDERKIDKDKWITVNLKIQLSSLHLVMQIMNNKDILTLIQTSILDLYRSISLSHSGTASQGVE